MNLVQTIDQYNLNNTYFCEPIKNNVMPNGSFIRIIYSTNIVILNGINLLTLGIHQLIILRKQKNY